MLSTLKILWSSLKMALQELRVNKLRTFLSLLGISIGIFCIIAVFTVTDSMESNIRSDLKSFGTNVIYIEKWPWDGGDGEWWKYAGRPNVQYNELKQLQDRVPTSDAATFIFNAGGKKIEYGIDYMENVSMLAVTADLDKMQTIDMYLGRYFTNSELTNGSNVIVLGADIWEGLFRNPASAIGTEIRFSGRNCRVIGLLKRKGESLIGGVINDNSVIMPYLFARSIVDERRWANPFLMVRARPDVSVGQLRDDLTGAMRAIRRLKPTEDNNFALNEVTTVQDNLQDIFGKINMGGALIAGFALIVGGFGIANIMFVTVKERTNIIGLKKAVGAQPSIIMLEFLLEAIVLCLIGGGIGLLFVYAGTLIAGNMFSDFIIALSSSNIILGLSISGFVGIVAGFIPAYSASRLDPVVAIRSN